jgi:molybdate transport system substrate-binding protein
MAELTVYSTIGVRSAAEDLYAQFAAASGHKVAVTWGTAPMLVRRIEGGETADVLVLSRAGLEALGKQGKVVPGSEVALASSGVGIAVKAGARKPDISTPEALKRTLLECKSISYSEPSAGGASGVYFEKLIEHMGIAAEMRPKTKYPPAGGFTATLLVSDEAELAVQQKPELLHVAGVEIIGMLPGDLNLITAFAAGLMPDGKHADAGKALIASLRSPSAISAFRAKGLDPA